MVADKIDSLDDKRITHCTATVNGRNYHYLEGLPQREPKDTIFLIHGWPDISMGWRYQIPFLLEMGLRVICPDMMGYGRTAMKEAPPVPSESLSNYTFKRAADDMKELAKLLGKDRIILGGHDWGAVIAYRIGLWHPEFMKCFFTVCVPFSPPSKEYFPLEDMVKIKLPNFGYQLQLRSGIVEKTLTSKEQIRSFLTALYGGRGPNGEQGFDVRVGVLFDNLSSVGPTPLLSEKELDYYVEEYARNGLQGPCTWYRTRETNFEDELKLENRVHFDMPVLFIQASADAALPVWMSQGQEKFFKNLTIKEVKASHWALWEAPTEVNAAVKNFLVVNALEGSKNSL